MGSLKIERDSNTIYTLSLSYGKDSLACLGAIKELGLPLDRIIHAEIWATETIPADLPPMVEFKKKADKIIKERYGIGVEHVCATKKMGGGCYLTSNNLAPEQSQKSTESISTDSRRGKDNGATTCSKSMHSIKFGKDGVGNKVEPILYRRTQENRITGFPISIKRGNWCTQLKTRVFFKPKHDGRYKYRDVSWNRCGRA
jgi:hypothetical protein